MSAEKPPSGDGSAAGDPPPAAIPPAVGSPPLGHGHGPHIQFRFLDQLKRRNVGRVAILYVAVCYLILEPFEMFFHLLELPAWTGRTVVLIMVLGFPAVLIFAWVFEVTPDGIKPTVEVDPRRSIVKQTGRRLDRAIIVLLALALIYFVTDKFWLSKHVAVEKPVAAGATATAPAPPAIPEKSVAVLPFVDMSEKRDQEYFSDGLSEELIDHLARTADLKVIARTSSFQFKGKNEDMRTIGQRLGVANLLEGSVRKSGTTLRITAQLIRVSDGSHLWSQSYDREMGDIFNTQDSIAIAVVTALRATLAASNSPSRDRPVNIEAYNALLRARYFRRKQTKLDTERSIAAAEEAIKLDPEYALAWSTIGTQYNFLGVSGWMPPKEAHAKAVNAVDRALAIDPKLAAAHLVLADLEWNYDRDFSASAAESQRACELDPYPLCETQTAGYLAIAEGHFDEAIRLFQKVAEADPLNVWTLEILYMPLFASNRLPEAERAVQRWLELEPNSANPHCRLGEVLLAENKPREAFGVMSEEADEGNRLTCVPKALWVLGRHAEADVMLIEAKNKYADLHSVNIAENYAMRNDKNEAFKWLAYAYDIREPYITLIKSDRLLNNLHGDPRFTALLRKMKLPE
jgi:adenylate cyclase